LPEKKIISFVKLKIIFKITGQSEYGRKLQSMIKMFFQQKIPEKKSRQVSFIILKTILASFLLNYIPWKREITYKL